MKENTKIERALLDYASARPIRSGGGMRPNRLTMLGEDDGFAIGSKKEQ